MMCVFLSCLSVEWQTIKCHQMAQAVEWLQKETVIRIGQTFRSIGGADVVTPQLLADCYERMFQWVVLAREALNTEWPSFEAIRAFSVFQLRPKLEATVVKKDLSKICTIFGEPQTLPCLVRSYTDCAYTASKKSAWD